MLLWPRPAPCAARIHPQSQRTPAYPPRPEACTGCGHRRSHTEAGRSDLAELADHTWTPAPGPNEPDPRTAKRAPPLTSILPVGLLLWAYRPCSGSDPTVPGAESLGSCAPASRATAQVAALLARHQGLPPPDAAAGSDRVNQGPIAIKPCVGASLRCQGVDRSAQQDWASRITIPFLWIFPPGNLFAKDSHGLELQPRITVNRHGESRLCWPNLPLLHDRSPIRDVRRERKKSSIFVTLENRLGIEHDWSGSLRSYIGTNGEPLRPQRSRFWDVEGVLNVALCRNQNSQPNPPHRISCKYRINRLRVRLGSPFVAPSGRIMILINLSPSI